MTALPLSTKEVTFGNFTMSLPADWGFEKQQYGLWWWGDAKDYPGVLIGRDERPIDAAAGSDTDKVAPIVTAIREVHKDMEGLRAFDVIPHPEGAMVRVVLDDDPDGIWEIRWYTLLVHKEAPVAAIMRLKLIFRSEHYDTPLATALDDLFHDQAMVFWLRAHDDRQPQPPNGFYRPLRRSSFGGEVTCNLPLAWITRRREGGIWWCANDQYLGSMHVYRSWTPVDLDEVDLSASVTATVQDATCHMLEGRTGVGIDLVQAGPSTITHFTYDDDERDFDPMDPDETPMRTHFWHVGQAVQDGIAIAGFNLKVPLSHADEPVFRDLVEDIGLSVRMAVLAAPGPGLPKPLDDSERRFDMNHLRVHTCYDFINICVPRRWTWEEANGRGSFAAEDESEETGTFWVDYDFLKSGHKVSRDEGVRDARISCDCAANRFAEGMGPILDIGTGDHPDGGVMWACSQTEEEGEILRIYRYDFFLSRPSGLLIVHFNLVLLESQADEPEFVELIWMVGREIEAARIG